MTTETLETLELSEESDPLAQEQTTYTLDPDLDRTAQVLFKNHESCINAAIWRTLGPNADLSADIEKDARDAKNRTLWWIRRNIQELLQPGTAKLTTRLYAGARLQALGISKDNLRNRSRFVLMDTTDESAVAEAKIEATRTEWDMALEASSRKANPAVMLRMWCGDCGQVSDVVSEQDGTYTLLCQHIRAA